MKTNRERGNALLYVLIAIALFAALSMTLGRQTDTSEAGALSNQKAEMYATQLMAYAAQAKSSVDQMLFSGTGIGDLDFALPNQAAFNSPSNRLDLVYHPDGGGLNPGRLPPEAIAQNTTDPAAGWYMGRFNNVEWTPSTATDVLLVAYQIKKAVCEKINAKITGSAAIPVLTDSIADIMIDDIFHSGVNVDFMTDPLGTPVCADCHKKSSLCVEDQATGRYGFYSLIEGR